MPTKTTRFAAPAQWKPSLQVKKGEMSKPTPKANAVDDRARSPSKGTGERRGLVDASTTASANRGSNGAPKGADGEGDTWEAKTAKRVYVWDSGASGVHGPPLAGDFVASEEPVIVAGGTETTFNVNQHGECLVAPDQGLLPVGPMAEAKIRATAYLPGSAKPMIGVLNDKDTRFLYEFYKARGFETLDIENGVAQVPGDLGDQFRLELRARRSAQTAKLLKGVPTTPFDRFYEIEYAPRFSRVLVKDFIKMLEGNTKETIERRFNRSTHMRVTTHPLYLATPAGFVQRTKEGAPTKWLNLRMTFVFKRRIEPVEVKSRKLVYDNVAMYQDDMSQHNAGLKQLEHCVPAVKLNRNLHDSVLVITLFRFVPEKLSLEKSSKTREARLRGIEMSCEDPAGPPKGDSSRPGVGTDDNGDSVRAKSNEDFITAVPWSPGKEPTEHESGIYPGVTTTVASDENGGVSGSPTSETSEDWEVPEFRACIARRRALKAEAVTTQWNTACRRIANELGGEDRRLAFMTCNKCGCQSWAEPVTALEGGGAKGKHLTSKTGPKDTVGRVLPACDDQHPHADTGCCPSAADCGVCQQAHLTSAGRMRGAMRCQIGDFSVDLLVRLTTESEIQAILVLAGYQKDPEGKKAQLWTVVAVPLDGKETETIYNGVMEALLTTEYLWGADPVKRIHGDREAGLVANVPRFREHAINITLTEGHASAGNPLAESAIRRVLECGKANLLRATECIQDKKNRESVQTYMWSFAMVFASMIITAVQREAKVKDPTGFDMMVADSLGKDVEKIPMAELEKNLTIPAPKKAEEIVSARLRKKDFALFGERVLYRRGHMIKPDKEKSTARVGWYLYPSSQVPRASVVMDAETGALVIVTTLRRFHSNKKPVFATTIAIPAVERNPEHGPGWDQNVWGLVECCKCLRWRYVEKAISEQNNWLKLEKDGGARFDCSLLVDGTTCNTKELASVWDSDLSRRKSGKDKRPLLKDRQTAAKLRDPGPEPGKRPGGRQSPRVKDAPTSEQAPQRAANLEESSDAPVGRRNPTRSTRTDPHAGPQKQARVARLARTFRTSMLETEAWFDECDDTTQTILLDWAGNLTSAPKDPAWFMREAKSAMHNWDSETDAKYGVDPLEEANPEPIEVPVQWSCEDRDGNPVLENDKDSVAFRAGFSSKEGKNGMPHAREPLNRGKSWDQASAEMDDVLDDDKDDLFRLPEHICPPSMRQAKVVKVFKLREAQQCRPKYAETVAAELGRHMEFSTYGKPIAKSNTPYGSVYYKGKMIYGVKNWETPAEQKDKARLVIQGCIRVTRTGKVLLEKNFKSPGEFWAPNSSMAGLRLVAAVGAILGLPIRTIDLDCAYLQSYAREEHRYLIFPPEVMESMPDDWQDLIRKEIEIDLKNGGNGEVVFPQVKNIYGKSDAGTNFIQDFQNTLEACGWVRLPHCHGTFLRFCPSTGKPMLLANYVDDLAVVLSDEFNDTCWHEIRKAKWQFNDPSMLTKFLGIVCKTFPQHGYRKIVLDQSDLMKDVVDRYEKEFGVLRVRHTLPDKVPALLDPITGAVQEAESTLGDTRVNQSNIEEDMPDQVNDSNSAFYTGSKCTDGWLPTCAPLKMCSPVPQHLELNPLLTTRQAKLSKKGKPKPPGEAGTPFRSAVGALFYAARGTRLDIMKAVHELARRVTKWTDECTQFLKDILSYCKGMCYGLVLDAIGLPTDITQWRIDLSTDARYHSPFSTTGIVITIAPCSLAHERFLTLDWTSHAQKYVKLNVAESEVVSAVHGMRAGLRYSASWAMIAGGNVDWCLDDEDPRACDQMYQRQDNTACIQQLKRGWSDKLSLLPILYGVSTGWAAQRLRELRVLVEHEGTDKMLADPLTKMTSPQVLVERGLLQLL